MRNLGLTIALWFAVLLPTNSLALGLGEIEVKSFLNQPLNAEIEVLSARPGEIDDLLVSLASREAFTRAGLSRPRHLSDLKFAVQKNEAGDQAVILVTTRSGVKEPFLNFLIEADWSKGRLLREYTILLDPPFYADQPAPTEPTPTAEAETISDEASVSEIVEQAGVTTTAEESGTEPIVETESQAASDQTVTEPIALDETTPDPVVEEAAVEEPQNIIQDDDVLVVKGDTLWSIASRYKSSDHSMAQVMLAFQRMSPEAFKDGNINLLKEGAILRVPDRDEIEVWGKQEAYAEVLVQNGLWEEYVERVTGVSPAVAVEEEQAVSESTVDPDPESGTKESTGELSLLMPESSAETTGTGETAEIEELRTKLAIAEEELDAARIENSELESRISELQVRLSKLEELQKMVEIEDDSLAQIQEQEAEPEVLPEEEVVVEPEPVEPEPVEPETTELVSEESTQSDEDALIQELLAEEAAAQAEEEALLTEPAAEDDGFTDETTSDESQIEELLEEDALTDDALIEQDLAQAEAEASEEVAPPAPVIVTAPEVSEPSMFEGIPVLEDLGGMMPSMPDLGGIGGLTSNPLVLAALGGVVVLLLLLILLKRRRAASDDSGAAGNQADDMFATDDEEELTPIHLAENESEDVTDIKIPSEEDVAATMSSTETMEPPEADEAEDEFAATSVLQATEMPEPEAPAPAAATAEQDDVLNEVDVYLAYGLYDNAEELLSTSIEANPERADYRSKLLDTYFATKNANAFVNEAQNLKSMGDAAAPYWDRVQVMGYELVPDNALFSDAKDSGMSAADLEIAKPQEADFDLGAADDDDTNFSTTDFNLGPEDTGGDFTDTQQAFGEAGDIAATQQIEQVEHVDELTNLDDEDDTNIRSDASEPGVDAGLELPEEIGGELEFSMDEPGAEDVAAEATSELDLPDELDLGAEEVAAGDAAIDDLDIDDMAMEFDVGEGDVTGEEDDSEIDFGAEFEAALEEADDLDLDDADMIPFEEEASAEPDDDAVELEVPEEEDIPDYEQTAIVDTTPGFEETEVVPSLQADDASDDDDIDLGMEDTAIDEDLEEDLDDDLVIDTGDDDDEEDISIIDFGGDDFVEPTDMIDSIDDDGTDDSIMMAVDVDETEEVKTGTFAPGDFDEPTAALDSIDDIGDLMLPDDVDEVSTKLDLARAFIDMGDTEGARGSLEEVMSEGNEEQKAEAKSLLDQL